MIRSKDGVEIHTVHVFVDQNNKFGNPVGVVFDEDNNICKDDRQKIATELGYSESVFVNNVESGNISIFNPQEEVKFAGHAVIGTAWLINKISAREISSLTCLGGTIKTWKEKEVIWIRASLDMMPPWQYEELKNPLEVENLSKKEISSKQHTYVWEWMDKNKGLIRARTFAPDWGILEDQANGSGSMLLAAKLKQEITVLHGMGSIIYAKPVAEGSADLGGLVLASC